MYNLALVAYRHNNGHNAYWVYYGKKHYKGTEELNQTETFKKSHNFSLYGQTAAARPVLHSAQIYK